MIRIPQESKNQLDITIATNRGSGVAQWHLTPEVRGSNPVIGQLLYRTFVNCQLYRRDKNKEKEAGNGLF